MEIAKLSDKNLLIKELVKRAGNKVIDIQGLTISDAGKGFFTDNDNYNLTEIKRNCEEMINICELLIGECEHAR